MRATVSSGRAFARSIALRRGEAALGLALAIILGIWAYVAFNDPAPLDTGLAYEGGQAARATGRPEALATWISLPFLAVVMGLVSLLVSVETAANLLTVLNLVTVLALLAGVWLALRPRLPLWAWWVSLAAAVCFAPMVSSLWWKQFNIIALALAVLGFWLIRRKRPGWVDRVILVDDFSSDATIEVARSLEIDTIRHPHNVGYGGNQKTCYMEALRLGADVVVMLHPDGQYDPSLVPDLVRPVLSGEADLVLGSRFLTPGGARRGGMPLYKYVSNRFLTETENRVLGRRFAELHTGYRAYSRTFLESVPFLRNSNDFVFDSEIIAQAVHFDFAVHEVAVATKYFPEASSASLRQSLVYGLKTLATMARFFAHRRGLVRSRIFTP